MWRSRRVKLKTRCEKNVTLGEIILRLSTPGNSRFVQSVMRPLMQYVDVCIGNEEDAELRGLEMGIIKSLFEK